MLKAAYALKEKTSLYLKDFKDSKEIFDEILLSLF